ncbi:zinc ion binding protein [Dorcoceras hygrometricum]|uniref:Zinc ion binding protein n=1 Tax=Dorcoceras hygrometricum TaxID=472368 RepID=A0A2Z7C0U2_9LAMI|nr:zinc ion binding protein [Dorcoceras hygrometricum]
MRGRPSWSNIGCYAGFAEIQSAGSIKLVHQLDEIEEQSSSADLVQRTSGDMKEDSCSERSNQLERKPAEKPAKRSDLLSMMKKVARSSSSSGKNRTRADDKRKLEELLKIA